MCNWIMKPIQGLIEPAIAPEFYIDGIGAVEMLNGAVRFYAFSEQLALEGAATIAHKIVAYKAIVPLGLVAALAPPVLQCVPGFSFFSEEPPPTQGPHLVKG